MCKLYHVRKCVKNALFIYVPCSCLLNVYAYTYIVRLIKFTFCTILYCSTIHIYVYFVLTLLRS